MSCNPLISLHVAYTRTENGVLQLSGSVKSIEALISMVDPVLASTSRKEWSLHVLVCHFPRME